MATKSKTPPARKRLKKLLTAIRNGGREEEPEILAELTAALAEDGAIAEVDALALVPTSAEQGMLGVVELLLARGADPRVGIKDWIPGLASLLGSGRAEDDARVIALAEKMVAGGADPSARSHGESALDRAYDSLPRVEALLRLGADEDCVIAALHPAIGYAVANPAGVAVVQRMLAHLASVDRPGPDGLSALHVVALRGTPALLAAALGRSARPDHPTTALTYFNCDGCSPPGGGIVPMTQVCPGSTALDLVEAVHAVYAATAAWYGDAGFDAARRRQRRDDLAANAAALAARGVGHGAVDRGALPGFVATVDDLLARLARHVGADEAALRRRAATVVMEGVGPWTYASTLLERSTAILLRGAVEAHVGDNWVAHLISGDHRRFVTARNQQLGDSKMDPSIYPAEAQRPLKTGMIVGGRGDELLVVWPHAEGVARLGVARPGAFTGLGDDFYAFLRGELAGLGLDLSGVVTGPAVGPGGGLTRVLVADHGQAPGPTEINRVGGLPIGFDAASWPRRGGAPMHHVLTIDLAEHPTYGPAGARALALFISSPSGHEAYTPGNDHTRVVLLGEEELRRGEPGWPPELAEEERLTPGRLRFASAATLTQEELYRHSFAGLMPIWLQGDDTERDGYDDDEGYGDAEDDGYDDGGDERPARPRHFVLQFDEALVPGINLGDAGIMYVFAETAWFQCH